MLFETDHPIVSQPYSMGNLTSMNPPENLTDSADSMAERDGFESLVPLKCVEYQKLRESNILEANLARKDVGSDFDSCSREILAPKIQLGLF